MGHGNMWVREWKRTARIYTGEHMNFTIRFRCPTCKARIKAPVQLQGQIRPCPGCGNYFTVRPATPKDSGPLVLLDDKPKRKLLAPGNSLNIFLPFFLSLTHNLLIARSLL